MLTLYGVLALSFMMLMYAFERRDVRFVLAFAFGCVLSSVYGFLAGAWPFGVVELVWAMIAIARYRTLVEKSVPERFRTGDTGPIDGQR